MKSRMDVENSLSQEVQSQHRNRKRTMFPLTESESAQDFIYRLISICTGFILLGRKNG